MTRKRVGFEMTVDFIFSKSSINSKDVGLVTQCNSLKNS